jgi:Photosynthetic reaction centre cytochrome C subunit
MIPFMRLLISAVMLLPLCAQPPQEGQKKGPPPMKNLKILQPEQVLPAMRSFTIALGVNCNYCHVQGDRASDENPKKDIARMMITMAHDINGKFPDGAEKMHVTCYTCHRGKTSPETAPPAAP